MSEQVPPGFSAPPVIEAEPQPRYVPLEKLPYPPYVLFLAVATMVAFVAALVRVPTAFSQGIAYEKAKKELADGKYDAAGARLQRIVEIYPRSKEARLDFIEAASKGAHPEDAIESLMWFDGRRVTKEESERLDQLSGAIKSRLEAEGK